ncbi:NAC093 [Arabidopsis thaliana]|uniref:NAC093 n=1 Tax=Arabidopsis thaliana TaxID=3702 RepID=A0A178UHS6_ARATH|nr:NAC093 [Arabidopsis thaliana]
MADSALLIFYKMKQVISMGGIMWEEEFEKDNDKEWFIITERNKVDQGLSQTKRVGNGAKRQKRVDTNGGYWHATVAAQKINAGDGVVGNKRPLAYYVGKPSEGVKTDWITLCARFTYSTSNKEVGEEKKKQKKGEPVEASEGQQPCNAEYHQPLAPLDSCQPQPHDLAEQLDLHQPEQLQLQQPHDIVYQPQYCLLPEQHQPQPFPYNFSELNSFQQQPVMIPDDLEDFLAELMEPHSLDGDEESNNYGFFEGLFDTEGINDKTLH